MFTSTKKEKISTQIMRQIRAAIMDGKVKPGEALPCEQDLVAQFGVSKHTLREALRALESLGLITIRRGAGGGPVVSQVDWASARDYFAGFLHFQNISLDHMHEVRKLVEPYIARQAAEKISPEGLDELRAVHKACVEALRRNKATALHEGEVRFHVLMAQYADNPFLWIMLDFVNNMLADSKHKLRPGCEFTERVLEAHERILETIAARDPDAAEAAMRAHIREVEEELARLRAEGSTD